MIRSVRLSPLVAIAAWLLTAVAAHGQTADSGWTALHRLDIPAARAYFETFLSQHPDNASALRGLILTDYMDCQYDAQFEHAGRLAARAEADPYATAVLEHVYANLESFSGKDTLVTSFAEAFRRSANPMTRHYGRQVQEKDAQIAAVAMPEELFTRLGRPPGCWMAGPFENHSRISAFRLLPFEDRPLDTSATTAGKNGARVEWYYVPANQYGEVLISAVVEDQDDLAGLLRFTFSIPTDQTVRILFGGAFHYRLRIDGVEVHEDKAFRNSVQREGVRADLKAGAHEITLALGYIDGQITTFSISVLRDDFEPIEGLEWLRAPLKQYAAPSQVESFHPLFDPLEAHIRQNGAEPDTRYWRSMLRIYNGFCPEAIRELEDVDTAGGLSLLEMWLLHEALEVNGEENRALDCLRRINERGRCARTDWAWIRANGTDHAAIVGEMEKMQRIYPDRFDYELMTMILPLLNSDVPGFLAKADSVRAKYPRGLAVLFVLSALHETALGDREKALQLFLEYCRATGDRRQELMRAPVLYANVRKFDEAVAAAREAIAVYGPDDSPVSGLVYAVTAANRHLEAEPLLDSLANLYPSNIDLSIWLHQIYTASSKLQEARRVLERIHRYKPSAVQPYLKLDSLHNNVPYDSIFGSVDAMALWDAEPSEAELAGKGQWGLVDRRQVLIFESGVACVDYQSAAVLVDQGTVERFQEYVIGFGANDSSHDLLTARRLRKGQPPLAGEHQGESILFRDLKPGDAIEVRYRSWLGNSGDLWNEFWDSYLAGASIYQRFWEYSVLSNRKDVFYATLPPCPEPKTTKHFGFTKTTWRSEHEPAMDLDVAGLPPVDDIVGKIFVSTLDDWGQLDRWYHSISEAILDDNPRATRLGSRLTAATDSPREKLRKLYESIVLEIPYQTISFDYDASIPHTPDEVLVNRWGDCKDKGHLLIGMLRAVGVTAWPVLVMTRGNGCNLPIPFFGFDHMIVGTVIDGDTLYVDPTSTPFAPEHSIGDWISGQPCLNISGDGQRGLNRLPSPADNSTQMKWNLLLQWEEGNRYSFKVDREWQHLSAGSVREDYRDVSAVQARKDKEAYFADTWGVTLSVDSLRFDSVRSVSPVFRDGWSGSMSLPSQTLGKTAVITLPRLCQFDKSLVPMLVGHSPRTQPVDLREFCGQFEYNIEVTPPRGLTNPQVADPVAIRDSLMAMNYSYDWDESSRRLRLTYGLSIRDGLVPVESFRAFVEKVIEVFESPLLFSGE